MTTHSGDAGQSQTMKASEFKAKCLGLMDEVAKLTAYHERPKSLFGIDKGRPKITGDIISPIDVEWEAQSDPDRVLNP